MRKRIPDSTVDLVIADPPFGIQETKFDKGFYERNPEHVLEGYVEAPEDYMKFTRDWMTEAVRSLRPGGSIYVIIGHSRLREVLTASAELGLPLINQCVYKYSFGTKTEKKYTTSHYNVLFYQKPGGVSTFNTHCRFGPSETIVEDGKRGSLLYRDLEDVFVYKRKNVAGEKKNGNCLPIELVEKLILYSSKEGDFVLDPFQGNFTTAYAARGLKRRILGFELNKVTFNLHAPQVRRVEFGGNLKNQRAPVIFVPPKRGKPFEDGEKEQMYNYFLTLRAGGVPSPQAVKTVSERHLRTTASIKRIVRDMKKNPPKISA
jgi:site-specific DNA-methyltransferase (adenine-specific)